MDVVPLCARMSEKSRFLIVFDFDYTMVDDNTDRVVQVRAMLPSSEMGSDDEERPKMWRNCPFRSSATPGSCRRN